MKKSLKTAFENWHKRKPVTGNLEAVFRAGWTAALKPLPNNKYWKRNRTGPGTSYEFRDNYNVYAYICRNPFTGSWYAVSYTRSFDNFSTLREGRNLVERHLNKTKNPHPLR